MFFQREFLFPFQEIVTVVFGFLHQRSFRLAAVAACSTLLSRMDMNAEQYLRF